MNELEKKIDDLSARLTIVEQEVKNSMKAPILNANIVEVFIPIKDNPKYYISSFGRVKRRRDGYFPKVCINNRGYLSVSLSGKTYSVHRLIAEAFIANPENKPFVDHKNGDTLDNRINNLRFCTNQENLRNRGKQSNNTSGFRGIYFDKGTGKYRARVTLDNGKKKHLGLYFTAEEASLVYEKAAKEIYGEFYRPQ